jgi:hypothetical protein
MFLSAYALKKYCFSDKIDKNFKKLLYIGKYNIS